MVVEKFCEACANGGRGDLLVRLLDGLALLHSEGLEHPLEAALAFSLLCFVGKFACAGRGAFGGISVHPDITAFNFFSQLFADRGLFLGLLFASLGSVLGHLHEPLLLFGLVSGKVELLALLALSAFAALFAVVALLALLALLAVSVTCLATALATATVVLLRLVFTFHFFISANVLEHSIVTHVFPQGDAIVLKNVAGAGN